MDTEAVGPQQIRTAFATAIHTAAEHSDDLTAIAAVLAEAADRYHNHGMAASTVAHIREAATAVTTAAAQITAAGEHLEAAVDDFDGRDGAVGDAVAGAGNLAATPILVDHGDATMTNTEQPPQPSPSAGPAPALPDVLGAADREQCFASDLVHSVAGASTELRLMDYDQPYPAPIGTYAAGQRFVEIAPSTEPGDIMAAPNLSPDEAEQAAAALDTLADQAEAGYTPPKPNKYGRAARRVRQMLDGGNIQAGEKIWIGDDDTLPITYHDLVKLLGDADPAGADTPRRSVRAQACSDAGGESGLVVMDLETSPAGTRVTVLPMEGTTDDPDHEFWDKYRARHTPEQARELAAKLRAFATAARHGAQPEHEPPAAPTATLTPSPPRRVRNGHGQNTEFDPATGVSYIVEPDGWRAPMPASSPEAVGIRLLYLREEIKAGRGEDVTEDTARALLEGMTVKDLQEVAVQTGVPATSNARTRAQLVDHVVKGSVHAAQKFAGLRRL